MATIQRQSIYQGPGTVQLGAAGVVFYDKDGIDAALEITRFDVPTSIYGVVDSRLDDVVGKIRFTPAGEVATADLTALYPHDSAADIGASIFGATDVNAIVQGKDGRKLTFQACAITKMPDMILSANKTFYGPAEITALVKDNTARTTAGSMYAEAASAWSDPASFASANVKTEIYTAAWGTLFTSIVTEAGWTISFESGIQYRQVDDIGTVDGILTSISVMARCRPLNLSASDILAKLYVEGAAKGRGVSYRSGHDLVLTGTTKTITLKDAALVAGPLRWGTAELRAGEIGFVAHAAESAGAFTTLFTIT